MKILWFTNGPGLALEYLTGKKGGRSWSASLNKEINQKIDLHVAFYYPKYKEPFIYETTHFYPICSKHWKLDALKRIIYDKFIDEDDQANYFSIINIVQPDLIHIHGTENPFGCIINNTAIPVVVSLQGVVSTIENKYLAGIPKDYLNIKKKRYDLISLLNRRSFDSSYRRMSKMAIREQKNLKSCKYIIGRTDWDRRVSRILAPESIYYGEDNRVLDEVYYHTNWEYPSTNNGFVIHTTTSNSYYKGFETICMALFQLQKIGFNVTFQVAGITTNDDIYLVVKKMLKNKFPKNNLKLLGNLNSEQVAKALCNAHLYVMPSHIENNSNSLCEAMLVGMPCISTFVGGIGSLITNNYDGIFIQDGDDIALAGTIIEICQNKEKLVEIAKLAKVTATKRHEKDAISRRILNIYNEILNN